MLAFIAKSYANCDRTARTMIVLSLVLIGLLVNSILVLTHYWVVANEVSAFLKRPLIEGQDDVAYIKSYISPNTFITKYEYQPKSVTIQCNNSTEVVTSFHLYAHLRDEGKYRAPLTCTDTLQNNLCSGHTYLEDPNLKSALNKVSPYLTQNILTENDLQMASLVLEYKNRAPSSYKPNYDDPKVAYVAMSATTPAFLHYAFDHISNKTANNSIIYSTFDYNSRITEEYNNVLQMFPEVRDLPTRWFGNWGGISLVYMEVSAWLELLKMENWDYLINISDGDGFVVPADLIPERLKELKGQSILECPYAVPYSQGYNSTCTVVDATYRFNDVWLDCGSSIRTIKHPNFSPKYPPYVNHTLKASQWKVFSRSAIEKLVSSQDFWDVIFSYRHSMIPDEHAIINAVKRVLPDEPFIYHNVHMKSWDYEKFVEEKDVLSAIAQGSWFIRRVRKLEEWAIIERVREEYWAKEEDPALEKKEDPALDKKEGLKDEQPFEIVNY